MDETEHERRRFYRVKEAAAIMGVPLRTMYHLAETGQIPCRRLGTVILVPVTWVEREPSTPMKR
jgi:excisionase family DNA binding protein